MNGKIISSYHVHVYYTEPTRESAVDLRSEFEESQFAKLHHIKVGKLHDNPIGPHTQAMFMIHVKAPVFHIIINHLMLHRRGLSVLIHPETGDVLKDHTDYAIWLGSQILLDISKL